MVTAKESFLIPGKAFDVQELFQEADAYTKSKAYDKAIAIYQQILEKYPSNLVEVQENWYINASRLAMQKLRNLPEEAQKLYQTQAGLDWEIVRKTGIREPSVLTRFLLTEPGAEAWMDQIDQALIQEKYEETISLLQYFRSFYGQSDGERTLGNLARLGLCHYALGNRYALAELQRKGDEFIPLPICGETQTLSNYLQTLLANVPQRIEIRRLASAWPTAMGNSFRNPDANQEIAQLKLGWMKEIPKPSRQRSERKFYYNEGTRVTQSSSPNYPIIADGMVFINNGQEIFALDLLSGEVRWRFKGLVPTLVSEAHEQAIHSVTYHQGALYVNIEGPTPTQQTESWQVYQIRKIITERKLLKLNAQTGQKIWIVQDEGDVDSFLNKVSFMTPPLVWNNVLYVGATELSGLFNSYVLALDPSTGKLLWKTLILAAQQELNMFGRAVRETAGSLITAGNGQLYYLTNLGACCSLSPITGQILWLYLYDRIPLDAPQEALFRTMYRETGWYNSPMILHGDKIFFCPIDSRYLYCLNALTGQRIWYKHQGIDLYHLHSVVGKQVLVTGNRLEFLDIERGTTLQTVLYGDKATGWGFISGPTAYIPCANQFIGVSLEHQGIVQKIPWPDQLQQQGGHLAIADSVLVVSGSNVVAGFYDWDAICKELEKRIANAPKASDCIRLASLYSQGGRTSSELLFKAKLTYEKILKLPSVEPDYARLAKQGLLETYLKIAAQCKKAGNLQQAYEYYTQALPFVCQPAQAIEILLEQYQYYQMQQNRGQAIVVLETLRNQYGHEEYFFIEKGTSYLVVLYSIEQLGKQYLELKQPEVAIGLYQKVIIGYSQKTYDNLPAAKWAQQAIGKIIADYGQQAYRTYDQEAKQLYENAKKEANSSQFKRLIEQYPNAQYVPQFYLDLGQALIQENRQKDAILELRNLLREYPNAAECPTAHYLLFQCYETLKHYALAKDILQKIKRDYSTITIMVQGKEVVMKQFIAEKESLSIYAGITIKTLPTLQLWDQKPVKYEFKDFGSQDNLRFLPTSGNPSSQYAKLAFFNYGTDLICRDGVLGTQLWYKKYVGWLYGVGFLDNTLVAWSSYQILRIQPETGEVLWREEISDQFVSMTLGRERLVYLTMNRRAKQCNIYVRDPETNKIVWTKQLLGEPWLSFFIQNMIGVYTRKPGGLYLYEIGTGTPVREFLPQSDLDEGEWPYYPVLLGEQRLCLIRGNKILECYEIPTFQVCWRYETSGIKLLSQGAFPIPLVVGNESNIAIARENGQLLLLDATSGDVKWTRQIQHPSQIARLMLDLDQLFVIEVQEEDQSLWALDILDGNVRWIKRLMDLMSSADVVLTTQYIVVLINRYAQGYQAKLMVYDKFTGEKLKEYEVNNGVRSGNYAEMQIIADQIWLAKDNIIWVLGKE